MQPCAPVPSVMIAICGSVRPARGVRGAVVAEQRGRRAPAEPRGAEDTPLATRTHRGGGRPLRFGNELTRRCCANCRGPSDSLPAGRLRQINDLLARRQAHRAHRDRGRTSRSSRSRSPAPDSARRFRRMLHDGMKAVTIRVNDVDGVAGFVLPGDRVDVMLTRLDGKGGGTTDVVLKNARCWPSIRSPTSAPTKPSVAKSVTLEVDTAGAQKLELAAPDRHACRWLLRKAGEAGRRSRGRLAHRSLQRDRRADGRPSSSTHHGHARRPPRRSTACRSTAPERARSAGP